MMSEEKQQQSTADSTTNQSESSTSTVDGLLNEIDRLGNQLIEAVKSAWKSDQRKQFEEDLSRGLTSFASELDRGIRKVAENAQTKTIINKAEEVISSVGEQVRTSKATQDIAEGLRKGLQNLNEQVAKFTSDIKKNETADNAAQDIPVQQEEKKP